MRAPSGRPKRIPLWQLALYGVSSLARGTVHPFARMWRSSDPIDSYALNHLTSVAGDAMLAIALADSVFFSLPVGEAKLRVAAYLGITMLPLALAGPLLVPLLDRAGPRRLIAFASAAGRALIAIYAAPRFSTLVLFPAALALLVLSKVHSITKNGLTIAYAGRGDGLMQANARLGRLAAVGAILAAPVAYAALRLGGSPAVIYVAAITYAGSAALTLRLAHPGPKRRPAAGTRASSDPTVPAPRRQVGRRGAVPALAVPAVGAIGMRAASGFLLFLLAFSLREASAPVYWFAVLAGAGVLGTFVADVVAPRLPRSTREEAVVVASVSAACIGALLAFEVFGLPLLTVFALVAGAATEFGRLAFQSLMQRYAPEGAQGRVFVRYEALLQLAWVGGAFLPVLLPIDFRVGILILAAFYAALGAGTVLRARARHDAGRPPLPPRPG
ncbi:MAG: MFS transporter [Actinomycetota bacterium]